MDPSSPVTPTTPSPFPAVLASYPTSTPTPSIAGPPNGAIKLTTIFAVVVGLVGFIVLALAGCYISRLPYFKDQSRTPRTLPSLRPPRQNSIRRQAPTEHAEPRIARFTPPFHRSQPWDHDALYLPPYEGPSPPPYSEATQHALSPPQHLRAPPLAAVEA